MLLDVVFSSKIGIDAALGSIATVTLNWGYRRVSALMQRAKSVGTRLVLYTSQGSSAEDPSSA